MKRFGLIVSVVAIGTSLLFVGCAKPPQQELAAAKAAVEAAQAVSADKYAAQDFSAVQDSLAAAVAEIKKQGAASALTRKYDKAKKLLDYVIATAPKVTEKATEEKATVTADAESALAKATAAVAEVKDLLKKKPAKGKAAKAAVEAEQKEITAAEAMIAETQTLKTNGDFAGARDNANAAIAKIEAIKTALTVAGEKPAKAKAGKAKSKKKK